MSESIVYIQGKPGSGKTTASHYAISRQEAWSEGKTVRHLSVGERFRSILKGVQPSIYADAVQDSVVASSGDSSVSTLALPSYLLVYGIVNEYLEESQWEPGITLIDGFPKDIELIELIRKQQLRGEIDVGGILNINVSDHIAVARQLGRSGITSNHPDYDESVAYGRVEYHKRDVEPVIAELAKFGVMLSVNGDRPLDDVQSDIVTTLRMLCSRGE